MNNQPEILTAIAGGFFVGILVHNDEPHALIVSPKEHGEFNHVTWLDNRADVFQATDYVNGYSNTVAMAEAGSELARKILQLEINGFKDWALPARDQLELLYRNAKPGTYGNACTFRDGDNPSSIPPGYPYLESLPLQCEDKSFQTDGPESLEEAWYWSSTQYSASCAWNQDFGNGYQDNLVKDYRARARAVRMIPLSHLVI